MSESTGGKKAFRAFEQTPLRLAGEKRRDSYSEPRHREKMPAHHEHSTERRAACAELTRLMEGAPPFSYLRLADGDLLFELSMQRNEWNADLFVPKLPSSIEVAFGSANMMPKDYPRLMHAHENCSWLDRYETVPYNRDHLHELKLNRPPGRGVNSTVETAQIFFDWTWYEMRNYLTRHRCLFCGAEAALLQALLAMPEYRAISTRFWPQEGASVFFLQPRNNGRQLSADLDLIKQDIAAEIDKHRIDTIFLSMAGAAKIIGYELSIEKNIRAFDFGSMLRALTYSGSDGQAGWRSCHHPFLLRVPFGPYMRALQIAHPDMDPVMLISKAHAQLCIEMLRKEPLRIHTSDVIDNDSYDSSRENIRCFLESYAAYRRHYYPWARKHPETHPMLAEFRRWRLNKGLGLDGRIYQWLRAIGRFLLGKK